jgi:hypothetical protein
MVSGLELKKKYNYICTWTRTRRAQRFWRN